MPALIVAAALAATPVASLPVVPSPVAPPPVAHDACANALVQQTAGAGSPPGRKLGDLPPARLMHAVLRRIDGCEFVEVRQASGAWTNVPAGAAWAIPEPARGPSPTAPSPPSP